MNEVKFHRQVKFVKFGEWTLDPIKQNISDGEIERELEPLLFRLLCYFILNYEKIITRKDLVDDVWHQHYVDDNAINRAVSELRKVLKSEKQKGVVVKTHYRKGYSFFLTPEIVYHTEEPATQVDVVNNLKDDLPSTPATTNTNHKLLIKLTCFAILCLLCFVLYEYSHKNHNDEDLIVKSSTTESVLSWVRGRYYLLNLSPNKQLAAFSFIPSNSNDYSLVVKNLVSGQERNLGEIGANFMPLGWSVDSGTIYYRVISGDTCQVWQVDADFSSDNNFLFDCELNHNMTGAGIGDNHLIYSKGGYRNRDELSVLTNRDLTSGREFQITSPNLNSYGDRFLLYIPERQLVVFERRQYDTNELYITDPDGGNQAKIYESENRIWELNYDAKTKQLIWLDNVDNVLYEYSLEARQLNKRTYLETNSRFSSFQALNDESLLLLSYPFDRDIYEYTHSSNSLEARIKTQFDEESGVRVKDGYLFLVREGSKRQVYFSETGEDRARTQIPVGKILAIRYNEVTNQLLLQYKDKIELYNYDSLRLIDTLLFNGVVASAEFMGKDEIGYVVIEAHKLKSKVYKYSISQKQKIELPILSSLWFDKLNETTLVSLSSDDKIVFYDINSGKVKSEIDLPLSKYKHSITVSGGDVYHSDGESVFLIKDGVIEKIYTGNRKLLVITNLYESIVGEKIILDTIENTDNQLIKVLLN
ncbi:transcriptional regulator [Pseudoalteromonas phenolica]|uniref:Transcriptional regulator n=1 Tax=Pseudoalteromonas phenolica TaxID=161398 RepID=A0A4Q7IPR5_9GAMM|nr:winged helix-turn-helix domain-containing protein [Pseudoalteromonas phenolica]RZQ53822.1 transcriptional regulator [Pseudoalteromonas phenolica]